MSQSRNVFTTEFKQECVKLVVDQGYGIIQAVETMSVGSSSLQRWVRQYRQELKVLPLKRVQSPRAIAHP